MAARVSYYGAAQHWSYVAEPCPRCGAECRITRSKSFTFCTVDACGWRDPPAVEGVAATGLVGPASTESGPPSIPVLSCRHKALRAANGGTCPRGCP